MSNPDLAGRRAVLRVHSQGKPIAPDADLDGLAKRTVGMSGADLANVINEAALLTARENGTVITGPALEEAVDRVVGGPRRKSRIISEHEKKITAYHEGGHTLAAWAMPDIDPIYKVTILARGRTGGHAMAVPEDDKGLMTRSEMIARLVFAMGGRAAEELVFREPTTGAVSDIEQATKIARAMVTEYGMSSKLGAVRYGTEHGDPFLGRTMGTQADYSHEVAQIIDDEVRKLIEAAHTEAWEILTEYRDVLDIAGRRAAGEGDAAPRRAAGDLRRREEAAPADHVRRLRWPRPVGQAADQDAGRAGDRARRGVAEAGARAGVQGRHRAGHPGRGSRHGQHGSNGNGTNGIPRERIRQPDTARLRRSRRLARSRLAAAARSQRRRASSPQGYWYPPPHWQNPNVTTGAAPPPYPPYQPYPQPGHPAPQGGAPAPNPNEDPGQDSEPAESAGPRLIHERRLDDAVAQQLGHVHHPGVRPTARRGGGPRAADRDRGRPRPARAGGHPGAGGAGLQGDVRRALHRPGHRAGHHL